MKNIIKKSYLSFDRFLEKIVYSSQAINNKEEKFTRMLIDKTYVDYS